jgi:hypothetical protein
VVNAPALLLHYDGFPSRENAFLVAVRLSLAEIFDHGQTHCFGRAKTEQPGVTYVQGDDFVPAHFEFMCPIGQLAANLVLDARERRARLDI